MRYVSFLPVTESITVDYIAKKVYIGGKESLESGKLAVFFSKMLRFLVLVTSFTSVIVIMAMVLTLIVEIIESVASTSLAKTIAFTFFMLVVATVFARTVRYHTKDAELIKDIGTNIYVIPEFKNYFLEYELYGDYSKFISKIEIVENHRLHITNSFRAVFHFTDIPLSGMMKLKYL